MFDIEEVNHMGPVALQNQIGTKLAANTTAAAAAQAVADANEAYNLLLKSMANGDIVFELTADQTQAATTEVWAKIFSITTKNAAGAVLPIDGIALAVSIADDSTAGTADVDDTTPTLVNGTVDIEVSGDAAAWLETEKATATLANLTYLGYTVTGGDMVVTITA